MSKDPAAPQDLADLQSAFAQSIMTPLRIDSDGYAYQQESYHQQAVASMEANQLFAGIDRLSIYNQQYWFRLLSLLQKEMPLTRHRLGIVEFNRMASAFLDTYPSEHPELHHLWKHMDRFMDGQHRWSTPSTVEAAKLDRIYADMFFAMDHQEFDGAALSDEQAAALLSRPLPFQSAFALFHEQWNSVRQRLTSARDDNDEIALPVSRGQGYWVIFRHATQGICEEELDSQQYHLLSNLHQGNSLTVACEELEQQLSSEALSGVVNNIQHWFARWSQLGWFRAVA